jgi:hypothetical protein
MTIDTKKPIYFPSGKELYNWEHAVELMDDDLREQIHTHLVCCTKQKFFDIYCKLHYEKFGSNFDI